MTGLGRSITELATESDSRQGGQPPQSETPRPDAARSLTTHPLRFHLPHPHLPHFHLPHPFHFHLPRLGATGEHRLLKDGLLKQHRLLDALTHSLDMAGRGYCCASDPLDAIRAGKEAAKTDKANMTAADSRSATQPVEANRNDSTGGRNAKLSEH